MPRRSTSSIPPQGDWWPRAVELWKQGYSQADIAVEVGLSRERIGQVAGFFPERPWVRRTELRELISHSGLKSWAQRGLIKESPSGLVNREEVEDLVIELLDRPCQFPDCGRTINAISTNYRFCAQHAPQVANYRYPVMTEAEKKKHYAAVNRWKAKNPEATKEINHRAGAAYRRSQEWLEWERKLGVGGAT